MTELGFSTRRLSKIVKSLFLASLAPVLLATAPADGKTDATRQSVPIQVVRVWQVADVSLAFKLPVFWGDHFMAVIQDSHRIVALDLDTGKEVWTRPLPAGIMGSEMALVGDRLVVSSEHLIEGIVLSTGATSWTTELPCEPPSASRLAKGLAILTCVPPSTPGHSLGKPPIVGLDTHRGQILWKLAPDHGVSWDQMGQEAYYYLDSIRRDFSWSSPGAVVAVDVSTGKVLWRRELRDAIGRIAVVGDTIVVSTSRIIGLSAQSGRIKYEKSIGPDPDRNGPAADASTELVVCDGHLFILGRVGVEVMAADTGKRRDFLPYPSSRRSSRGREDPRWFLLCENSRILMDSWLTDGQQQVFLREGNAWRPVHGLARGETVWAFARGQIIVQSEAGLAGYSLGEESHAQH